MGRVGFVSLKLIIGCPEVLKQWLFGFSPCLFDHEISAITIGDQLFEKAIEIGDALAKDDGVMASTSFPAIFEIDVQGSGMKFLEHVV